MIQVDFCQNILTVVNFTADYIRTKSELFPKKTIDAIYLTGTMQIECLKTLSEY